MATMKQKLRREKDIFNPLIHLTETANIKEWHAQRLSIDELVIDIKGDWGVYKFSFSWDETSEYLTLSIYFDLYFGKKANDGFYELLNTLNRKSALGHFEFIPELFKPSYCYALYLPNSSYYAHEYFEDLIDDVLSDCDRFYPALRGYLYEDISVHAAISHAMMTVHGHA